MAVIVARFTSPLQACVRSTSLHCLCFKQGGNIPRCHVNMLTCEMHDLRSKSMRVLKLLAFMWWFSFVQRVKSNLMISLSYSMYYVSMYTYTCTCILQHVLILYQLSCPVEHYGKVADLRQESMKEFLSGP